MTTEPLNVRSVFDRALDLESEADRRNYLNVVGAAAPEVRRKVESLLQAHANAGKFLETSPLVVETAVEELRTLLPSRPSLDFLMPSDRPDSLGRLGRYEILELIGSGGFGLVLKAFDEKLRRIVAIKTLNQSLAVSASARQRFLREARAAAAVNHDYVVHIYEVEDADPTPYLVMEHVAGVSLDEKLRRDGPLELGTLLRIGVQTAEGLAAAHLRGLVHRDVKPGNILLEDGTGRARLTDFGLARAVDDLTITRENVVAGTPEYMAPEQARGAAVDHRADLFSLGSVLYAMCTGCSPFTADGTQAVLRRICEDTPADLRKLRPDVPPELTALISRLHAKQPVERPQSAEEVRALLARCAGSGSAIGPARTISRRQWLSAAGAVAAVGGLSFCVRGWRTRTAPFKEAPSGEPAAPQTPSSTGAAPRRWPPQVLIAIASRDFFYAEYHSVRVQLEMYGVDCRVASTTLDECLPSAVGPTMPVKPDLLLADARAADYDVVYFCGGRGSLEYAEGGKSALVARRVIGEALAAKRTVAAMSSGVVVLAEADALRGRQAACNPYGDPPGEYARRIEARGVNCSEQAVVEDGPFLTGRAPQHLQAFVRALQNRLGIGPQSRSQPPPSD